MTFWTELTGTLAAILTTMCWLPQLMRILRTKETAGVSAVTYTVLAAGVALWLAYGLMLPSAPVIGANAVTLVLVLVILGLRLRHGPGKTKKLS